MLNILEDLPFYTFEINRTEPKPSKTKYRAVYIKNEDNETTITFFAEVTGKDKDGNEDKGWVEITTTKKLRDIMIGSLINSNVNSGVYNSIKKKFVKKMQPKKYLDNYSFYKL